MRDQEEAVSARSRGVLVVEVRGELDIGTVLRWTTLIEAAICELPDPHLLVVDLASLEFLSVRGARGLFEVMEGCRGRGIAGCLIATPGTVVERAVRLTGLAGRVPVFPSRLAAIAAYQPVEMRWLPV
ncbi:STAS domain-containing protein [Amycolatopsis australiensis]|uniref:Anti-anti-sigma factor n=1 Tax=Amycolatopsis australiensis TaxID=546364 RepID=A0A1K1STA0_9PSEU|nr:STAS domain-containing protein [Amycolatopsis australiensis]SFW87539.1 anti-anti-sigma factor [Amycolatopsis australiensis]